MQFAKNFINKIIEKQLPVKVVTRFPPEPSGYLHLGHAKSIILNYSLAQQYHGDFILRFDDTNPLTSKQEYCQAIIDDILWLGIKDFKITRASDYFKTLIEFAFKLINDGKAYVCKLSYDDYKLYKGGWHQASIASDYRNKTINENFAEFHKMINGQGEDHWVLRAKIDINSPNMNLRDPVIYRTIKGITNDHKYHIYPSYDYAQPLCDYLDGVTYSICTLEFVNNKPLYVWLITQVFNSQLKHPQQIEFARLEFDDVLTSKRAINKLIVDNHFKSWNDKRLFTLSGLRNRGCPPEAIINFCYTTGVSKSNCKLKVELFNNCLRSYLDKNTQRYSLIFKPLLVEVTNLDLEATYSLPNHPQKLELGFKKLSVSNHLYIEANDFKLVTEAMEKKLSLNNSARLLGLGYIEVEKVEYDSLNNVSKLVCRQVPDPKNDKSTATIHWIDANNYQQFIYEDDNYELTKVLGDYTLKDATAVNTSYRFQAYRHGYFLVKDGKVSKIIGLKKSHN